MMIGIIIIGQNFNEAIVLVKDIYLILLISNYNYVVCGLALKPTPFSI